MSVHQLIAAQATFTIAPVITILNHTAVIQFVISGPLTHIVEMNCVTDTTTCINTTIPVSAVQTHGSHVDTQRMKQKQSLFHGANLQHNRSIATEIYNFTSEVPLVDPVANSFEFSFDLYHGDDLISSNTTSVGRLVIEIGPGGKIITIII